MWPILPLCPDSTLFVHTDTVYLHSQNTSRNSVLPFLAFQMNIKIKHKAVNYNFPNSKS